MNAKFTDSFEQDCQKISVPKSLLSLVGIVLDGPDIKSQSGGVSQAGLSIAQLVQFNGCIQRCDGHKNLKHNQEWGNSIASLCGTRCSCQGKKKRPC